MRSNRSRLNQICPKNVTLVNIMGSFYPSIILESLRIVTADDPVSFDKLTIHLLDFHYRT